jgi:hypothetical protein
LRQSLDIVVDEFASVIGMEAQNAEWKRFQHAQQQRFQPSLRDMLDRSHHLPLRNFVYRVDVINALDSIQIALVYRVHAQIPVPIATGVGRVLVKTIRCSR